MVSSIKISSSFHSPDRVYGAEGYTIFPRTTNTKRSYLIVMTFRSTNKYMLGCICRQLTDASLYPTPIHNIRPDIKMTQNAITNIIIIHVHITTWNKPANKNESATSLILGNSGIYLM